MPKKRKPRRRYAPQSSHVFPVTQLVALEELCATGSYTADDIRRRIALPTGYHPNRLGQVPRMLEQEDVIRREGFEQTNREIAHGRNNSHWILIKRVQAEALLKCYRKIVSDAITNRFVRVVEADPQQALPGFAEETVNA